MDIDFVQFFSLSTVSALLAFCLNQLLALVERKKRLKAASLLLLHEVNRHVHWLRQLDTGDDSPLYFMNSQPDKEWEKLKYEMFQIRNESFTVLVEHYLAMNSIRVLANEAKEKGFLRVHKTITRKHLELSLQAYEILFKLSGKNSTTPEPKQ